MSENWRRVMSSRELRASVVTVDSSVNSEKLAVFTQKVRSNGKITYGVILQRDEVIPLLNLTPAEARELATALLLVAAEADARNR